LNTPPRHPHRTSTSSPGLAGLIFLAVLLTALNTLIWSGIVLFGVEVIADWDINWAQAAGIGFILAWLEPPVNFKD
jgi:hypothetical protein